MAQFAAKLGFRPILAPCSEEDIRSFEQERQIRIPDDFREFLLQWNGGAFAGPSVTDEVCFPIPEELDLLQEPRPLNFLAGLCPKHCYVALHDLEEKLGFEERVPKDFVVVGLDFTTLHLCLCCSGADRGKVFCWDSFWDPDPEETLYRVADSFREFWDSLHHSDARVSWDTETEERPTIAEKTYEPKLGFRPLLADCFSRDIQQAENWLEIQFPPDYRRFLEEWNGGYFASNLVGCDLNGSKFAIDALFGVGPHHTRLHVHDYCTTDYYVKRLPPCTAVIGKTTDYQLVVLQCGDGPGIYVTLEPGNAIHVDKFGLRKLAAGFREFWRSLKTLEPT